MKKKYGLFVFLFLFVSEIIHAYDFSVNNIFYKVLDHSNKTVAVTYGNSNYNYARTYSGDITIPSTVSYYGTNYTVKEIGDHAFYYCNNLKSVVIPSSVTKIGESAFHNSSNLTTIDIPSTVVCIEKNAFWYCNSLVSADIPSSVDSIDAGIFNGCTSMPSSDGNYIYAGTFLIEAANKGIVNATIKQGTKFIGSQAFYECKQLSSVFIPSSVVLIGSSAFDSCSNLTSIDLPNGLKKIDSYAFAFCNRLSAISIPSSVEEISSTAFFLCNSFPVIDGIRYADTFVISANYGSNKIKEGTRIIGNAGFSGITSIHIPSSVVSIDNNAFSSCKNLSVITVDVNNKIYDSREDCNALIVTETNTLILGCKNTAIPNGITGIGASAFEGISSLSSITFPESLETIGRSAFRNCNGLLSVVFSENIATIDNYAFQGCTGLTSLSIPSSVATIGDYAFQNCTNLTEIANYSKVPQQISANTFTTFGNLRVPKGSGLAYSNATYWKNFNVIDGLTLDLDLADGTPFVNSTNVLYDQLTYTRNFTSDNWQALYVPFTMQYEDWAADFEVARLNDVHQFDDDDDGEIDRTVLEVVKMKEGSMTEPNTPYMIRAKEVGEKIITLNNTTLYATVENSVDVTSWNSKFTFTGTYSTVTDMATKGHYALANGGLMQASSDAATLSAFRWYLDVTDRNGNPAPLKAKKVLLSFDDGEETAIDLVEANEDANAGSIYSISGVKVGTGRTSLSKGLYISNGKKYLIK